MPANIAEEFKRLGKGDKLRFHNIAEASLEEVTYYFILAKDLGYLEANQELLDDAEVISRMLFHLTQSTNDSSPHLPPPPRLLSTVLPKKEVFT